MTEEVPIVDLTAYYRDGLNSFAARQVVQALHHAASTWGFFIITGANVSTDTQSSLLSVSKDFFNLPLRTKSDLDVREGGAAWRGYMPLGGEYTHGHLDWKEGLYVGPEHADNHHLFGLPLHGKNRFPDQALPCMRQQVLQYVGEVTELGKVLTDLFSVALSLPQNQLREKLLEPEPVVLFRIFKYPCLDDNTVAPENDTEENFGIGEHTGKRA
jgi:isopenicillin N synthase-like dioxygenase